MTSQEMMKAPPLKNGYWFVNVSKVDQPQNWQVLPIQPTTGDDKLFGYDVKEFMAKQYK